MDTFFRQKNHGAKLKGYAEDVSGPWSHKPPRARSQMCGGLTLPVLVYFFKYSSIL